RLVSWEKSIREVRIMRRPLRLPAALTFFALLVGAAAAPSPCGPALSGVAKCVMSYFSPRSVMAAPIPEYSANLEQTQYNKWKVYKLSNGLVSLFVAPEIGGRAIQLQLGDQEYFFVNKDLGGKVLPE